MGENKTAGGISPPEGLLNWLKWVSGVGALLGPIFALLFPNLGTNAQRLAIGLAILLGIGWAAISYYERQRSRPLLPPPPPPDPKAGLRGLLPFEEGDQLFGREQDVRDLFTLLASREFRFGVLTGESGCGKTSLLRAGLVPRLKEHGFLPLYLVHSTKDPQQAIRAVLDQEESDEDLKDLLRAAAPPERKVVVIFDQFEEFFLSNRTARSQAAFSRWLAECVNDDDLPVIFLVSIRGDFFLKLHDLDGIREPTSRHTTYRLENFRAEQARRILNDAARADQIVFEPELIDAVVTDLEVEEMVRPADLQIVGTWLKRRKILDLNKYRTNAGGAQGILRSYVKDEIKESGNEHLARLVLRAICPEDGITKSPTGFSFAEITRAIDGDAQHTGRHGSSVTQQIQGIIDQFIRARILIHTPDNKYNLVHDDLVGRIREATADVETNLERANRLLKQFLALYTAAPHSRIPLSNLRYIQRYASDELKERDDARRLIRKSYRAIGIRVGAVLGPPTLLVLVIFAYRLVLREQAKGPTEYFPAGTAWLGNPGQPVDVPAFRLDVHEVTYDQYKLCVRAGVCSEPTQLIDNPLPKNKPMVWVSAYDAAEFCKWVGRRLPTVVEWERAARGLINPDDPQDKGRIWPWGDQAPDPDRANMILGEYGFFPEGTVAVNDLAFVGGDTPEEGITHLVGNVSEWTRTPSTCGDLYDCPAWDGKQRVPALEVRGFGWTDDYRFWDRDVPIAVPNSVISDAAVDTIGFRCASDP